MVEDKQTLARERTDWAEDRTVLANERTYAGWLRTGLGAIAIALGLQAVFQSAEALWLAKSVASGFLVIAALIFWQARGNATRALQRLDRHDAAVSSGRFIDRTTFLLIAITAAVAFVLWRL